MEIRILGAHNCESQSTRCVCFIIDNSLAVEAGGITSVLSRKEQQELNAILLTHQHYDHIRDIPGLALNFFQSGDSIDIYSTAEVFDVIDTHILNDRVYPRFQQLPEENPTIKFNIIEPLRSQWIDGHRILPVPMNHCGETVGYEISDRQGNVVFYTADTGPELADCWKHISPQLIISEVTLPNAAEEFARKTGHLTPDLLEQELIEFRELKGSLPPVAVVHMDATQEAQIKREVDTVATDLEIRITVLREGMRLSSENGFAA